MGAGRLDVFINLPRYQMCDLLRIFDISFAKNGLNGLSAIVL